MQVKVFLKNLFKLFENVILQNYNNIVKDYLHIDH
jgi:hypothetical protein